ncbi:MAG: cryptochrome/photolyase family protein [Pyrinomonadaceae bacterium]|nr:cryptochrome/photolyase family protein [Pyrinomonadaceae bacterium]
MSTNHINLIFPHQLYEEIPKGFKEGADFWLIEEHLFFGQYKFHKQKLAFQRSSMKAYAAHLQSEGHNVVYTDAGEETSDIRKLVRDVALRGVDSITYIDPTDDWLESRLRREAKRASITLERLPTSHFLLPETDTDGFFKPSKKKFYQTSFYKDQRKKFGYLLDKDGNPEGGSWTYDADNRKPYPKNKLAPKLIMPDSDSVYEEAVEYVRREFPGNPGEISGEALYPYTFQGARDWLQEFLNTRFKEFGDFEDAIVQNERILNHSVLSPLLNTGLLPVNEVIEQSLEAAERLKVPINSTEGFIRQIIGWREFIRGVYESKGRYERTRNFWGFTRKIPISFYDGTTGIDPVDTVIGRVNETGYSHHIERLMVLGNFMLLCEFDPDEVYRWFMELFVDSYDWVMVPNVYGMSQFADGGLMSTKPYISGSNYLLKMSDFRKGEWCDIWDGLFWRFLDKQRDFFSSNPRMRMLLTNLERMEEEKRSRLFSKAEGFLKSL